MAHRTRKRDHQPTLKPQPFHMRRISHTTPPASTGGRHRRTQWRIALALALALATKPHASDAALDRAADLIGTRDAASAYAKLAPLEATRAGKPRFDYLFGLAALDSSHVTHAIFALER